MVTENRMKGLIMVKITMVSVNYPGIIIYDA